MEGDTDMAIRGAESEGHSNSPLVTSIAKKIARLHPMPSDICIYRAPPGVRELHEKAYTPRRVSIGPLHHGKEHLFPMEEQKLRYLSAFLHRTGLSLDDCASFIRGLEDRVRNCYAESFNFTSDEFVEMILVDSSFIIEVICRYNFLMRRDETDYLNKLVVLVDVVKRDMILLENQIPYFVLEGLFNLAFPRHSPGRHSLNLIDTSEIVLRNLIAFETCHYFWDSYIIDYVVFMNDLMDNAQDVDILVQNEIFENSLVDRASVATLFHNLTSDVLLWSSNYYYHDLCQKVTAYCKDPWHKWKAIMKHDYFSTPWRIVSVVAAVMLLVLSLIQTICSVISVLQKK